MCLTAAQSFSWRNVWFMTVCRILSPLPAVSELHFEKAVEVLLYLRCLRFYCASAEGPAALVSVPQHRPAVGCFFSDGWDEIIHPHPDFALKDLLWKNQWDAIFIKKKQRSEIVLCYSTLLTAAQRFLGWFWSQSTFSIVTTSICWVKISNLFLICSIPLKSKVQSFSPNTQWRCWSKFDLPGDLLSNSRFLIIAPNVRAGT